MQVLQGGTHLHVRPDQFVDIARETLREAVRRSLWLLAFRRRLRRRPSRVRPVPVRRHQPPQGAGLGPGREGLISERHRADLLPQRRLRRGE